MNTSTDADHGHTFRIRVAIRGSSKVVGDDHHHDAPEFVDLPGPVDVRAWNLRDALTQAAALPLGTWIPEDTDETPDDEPEAVAPEPTHPTALTDTALTDEEWRTFQQIPDQGHSHRHWLDTLIAARVHDAVTHAADTLTAQAHANRQAGMPTDYAGVYAYAAAIIRNQTTTQEQPS